MIHAVLAHLWVQDVYGAGIATLVRDSYSLVEGKAEHRRRVPIEIGKTKAKCTWRLEHVCAGRQPGSDGNSTDLRTVPFDLSVLSTLAVTKIHAEVLTVVFAVVFRKGFGVWVFSAGAWFCWERRERGKSRERKGEKGREGRERRERDRRERKGKKGRERERREEGREGERKGEKGEKGREERKGEKGEGTEGERRGEKGEKGEKREKGA
eukprot:Skav206142  [mRNA]  locus=scaffold471:142566:144525:+ [translate_table: standard]